MHIFPVASFFPQKFLKKTKKKVFFLKKIIHRFLYITFFWHEIKKKIRITLNLNQYKSLTFSDFSLNLGDTHRFKFRELAF